MLTAKKTVLELSKAVKMKLSSTLKWPLRIWQIFGMTPFEVCNKSLLPVKNAKLQMYAGILLLVHIILLIISLAFTSIYIDWSNDTDRNLNELVEVISIRLTVCVIVAEAIFKANQQTEFLCKIIDIDGVLRRKLHIKMDYKKQQFYNNILTVILILTCVSCVILVAVVNYEFYPAIDSQFWLWYALPFIVYSIHYHRMVLFVHLILYRYKSVNQFIENVCLLQEKRQSDNFELLLATKKRPKVTFTKLSITASQLVDIRNVYQNLYETTEMINDMFRCSLPLCIGIDFHRFLLNTYFIVAVIFLEIEFYLLFIAIFCGCINIAHLLFLSHACHSTSKQVTFQKLIYKINKSI